MDDTMFCYPSFKWLCEFQYFKFVCSVFSLHLSLNHSAFWFFWVSLILIDLFIIFCLFADIAPGHS